MLSLVTMGLYVAELAQPELALEVHSSTRTLCGKSGCPPNLPYDNGILNSGPASGTTKGA